MASTGSWLQQPTHNAVAEQPDWVLTPRQFQGERAALPEGRSVDRSKLPILAAGFVQALRDAGFSDRDIFDIASSEVSPVAGACVETVDLSGTVNNDSEFEMMTIDLLTTGFTVLCAASCIASIGCSITVCCVLCIDCKLNNG